MKILKRILQSILIIVLIGLVFRGSVYRKVITYKSIGERVSYSATNKNLIKYIEENTINAKGPKIEKIIDMGLSATSRLLRFTASKNHIEPNKLINTKTANCIGYATFFSANCNYLLKKYALDNNWIAKPHKGNFIYLVLIFINISNQPFLKTMILLLLKIKEQEKF
ncbi:hypothetical protein CXF68_19010 [Tenacibaculum sp. Bg11-29]|uniref:hypothetical protein n=1 Tax=Tenacibaculum sp. Bg11-29 TaxID=2058306 RepID=UPI000C31D23A|nr:hypothetical protein [Tenacibaculum sp. Bg11-29]PKH52664.1 hypothetical protein CXF68_19010 [Tenacibaculum sp. Bg11-29]